MKTYIAKPSVKALLATLVCLTFGHLTASAAGGSSGNGNGDSAFAFQAIVDENPGLDDIEILKKAFEESAGRLPEIVKANDVRNRELLAFKSEIGKFNGIMLYRSNDTGEIVLDKLIDKTFLLDNTLERGPLLSPAVKNFNFFFNQVSRTASIAYIQKSGILVMNDMLGKGQKVMEIRQFSPNVLIYALFATKDNNNVRCLFKENDYGNYDSGIRAKDLILGQICAMAYSWKSN